MMSLLPVINDPNLSIGVSVGFLVPNQPRISPAPMVIDANCKKTIERILTPVQIRPKPSAAKPKGISI